MVSGGEGKENGGRGWLGGINYTIALIIKATLCLILSPGPRPSTCFITILTPLATHVLLYPLTHFPISYNYLLHNNTSIPSLSTQSTLSFYPSITYPFYLLQELYNFKKAKRDQIFPLIFHNNSFENSCSSLTTSPTIQPYTPYLLITHTW